MHHKMQYSALQKQLKWSLSTPFENQKAATQTCKSRSFLTRVYMHWCNKSKSCRLTTAALLAALFCFILSHVCEHLKRSWRLNKLYASRVGHFGHKAVNN